MQKKNVRLDENVRQEIRKICENTGFTYAKLITRAWVNFKKTDEYKALSAYTTSNGEN